MSYGAVLVVEDDLNLREALCDTLQLAGFPVVAAANGDAALSMIDQEQVSVVVSDVQMKPMDGYSLLKKLKSQHPNLPVVLMTAYGTIQKAVQAMREGASDYLVKPFDADALVHLVERYIQQISEPPQDGLVAVAPQSKRLMALAQKVAESDATVMITGESGSGKEIYARYIHAQSTRKDGPFVAINCAAIPENMLEAMIFGHEKGAFTGAYSSNAGKFEQANGGTILLDEISEMGLALQAKLLRVLQEREVERLGGKKIIPLDVRVLATSNRNLREEVAAGRFREDLFYRLNVFPLHLPPLATRREDVLPLAENMLNRWCMNRKPKPVLSDAAKEKLFAYDWPGNVRELDNVIQRSLILMGGDCIEAEDICFETQPEFSDFSSRVPAGITLPQEKTAEKVTDTSDMNIGDSGSLGDDLKSHETQLIMDVLKSANGNRKAAAEKLGISPRTLRYKLARLRESGVQLPA